MYFKSFTNHSKLMLHELCKLWKACIQYMSLTDHFNLSNQHLSSPLVVENFKPSRSWELRNWSSRADVLGVQYIILPTNKKCIKTSSSWENLYVDVTRFVLYMWAEMARKHVRLIFYIYLVNFLGSLLPCNSCKVE